MTQSAGISSLPSAPFGYWTPAGPGPLSGSPADFRSAIADLRTPATVVATDHGLAVAREGSVSIGPPHSHPAAALPVAAYLPALTPDHLGDAQFRHDHGLKYAYMTGAMANGIGSC